MPMAAYAFDTLKSVDRLKGAKVLEEQARAFVEVFQEIQQGADLATKADLTATENALRFEMHEMELRLENRIEATHTKIESTKVDMMSLKPRAIDHSDRGCHTLALSSHRYSVSTRSNAQWVATGNCFDNAAMESFFAWLERKQVYQQ